MCIKRFASVVILQIFILPTSGVKRSLGRTMFHNGVAYFFCDATHNYNEAKQICKGRKSSLVNIYDVTVQAWVARQLTRPSNRPGHYYWIGARRDDQGRFRWADGSYMKYKNWKWKHNIEDNCVAMYSSVTPQSPSHGKWFAHPCSMKRRFICQKERDPNVEVRNSVNEDGNIEDNETIIIAASIASIVAVALLSGIVLRLIWKRRNIRRGERTATETQLLDEERSTESSSQSFLRNKQLPTLPSRRSLSELLEQEQDYDDGYAIIQTYSRIGEKCQLTEFKPDSDAIESTYFEPIPVTKPLYLEIKGKKKIEKDLEIEVKSQESSEVRDDKRLYENVQP